MGLDDLVNVAKGALGDHADQADGAIDSVADAVKDKAPDQADGAVDAAAEKAKDLL